MIDEIHLSLHKFHQSSVTKQIACKPKPSSTKEASCHLPPFRRRDHRNLLSSVASVASSQPSPVRRIAGACLSNLCDVHRSNPHRAMVQLLSSGAGEEAESPLCTPTIASLTAASPDYGPSEGPVSAESPISATTIYSADVPAQSPSSAMTPTVSSPEAFEEDFEGA
ncbi:hypothetical protein LWI29_019949 [Acer saccharum]|uniref:Uncharacterized protein n=1 Tax=Acer saccharum TaxID=4024 RepID=A0AA39S9D0_ACESA|nr:hypothetical protein LWI29_019949 [Acer saccharum]